MPRPCGTAEVVAPGGRMPLAVCVPDGKGPFPGVLVLMEAFGLNADIRAVAGRLADEGFLAIAPDLYYREHERTVSYEAVDRAADLVMRTIALSDSPEERVKDDRVVADIAAAMAALKAHPQVDAARIGVLGFGMGGRLAFLTGCRMPRDVRVVASFYPGHLVPVIGEARQLAAPVLLVFGGRDSRIPLPQIDRIQAELAYLEIPHDIRIYPGADHGFFHASRRSHDSNAASDAWRETLSWFSRYLGR